MNNNKDIDPDQYWIQIADIVDGALSTLIDRIRVSSEDEIIERVADLATPLMWQVAVIAAAAMDRGKFLAMMGTLYDNAEITLATGRPVVEIFRLISPRGQA